MTEVYVLMEDRSGTTFSSCDPIGIAVSTETEAKKFVEKATPGFMRTYEKIKLVESHSD